VASLPQKIRRFVARHGLPAPGQRVLLGVSGGGDSVAMLQAFRELAPSLRIDLCAAHLDHRMRGAAGAADAAFVEELCRGMGVPCVRGRADVPRLARRRGLSLEAAAREARYAFFARAARRAGGRATVAATAHTADDQAETLLLRLIRGAGARGLAGIAPRVELAGLAVIRPMLDVTRDEARRFLRSRGLAWREDASNRDVAFLRNRVRHRLLPLLEAEYNPRIKAVLARAADVIAAEDRWLEGLAGALLDACARPGARGEVAPDLDAAALGRAAPAAQRRALRLWLGRAGAAGEALDYDAVTAAARLLGGAAGTRRARLPGGWTVTREYGRLAVGRGAPPPPAAFRARLRVPGVTALPGAGLTARVTPVRGPAPAPRGRLGLLPATVRIDAAAAGRRGLCLRSWKKGDRIAPSGMRGRRKLQDLFTDAKVPAAQRGRVPVLECAGQVVWVAGYRPARGWEARPGAPALAVRVEAARPPPARRATERTPRARRVGVDARRALW